MSFEDISIIRYFTRHHGENSTLWSQNGRIYLHQPLLKCLTVDYFTRNSTSKWENNPTHTHKKKQQKVIPTLTPKISNELSQLRSSELSHCLLREFSLGTNYCLWLVLPGVNKIGSSMCFVLLLHALLTSI